jgi:3'-5' exonuclease
MDGSAVWSAYVEGKIDDIRDYCETDVVNTDPVYLRFQQMRGG